MGLITKNDELLYRNQIASLVDWCNTNNLELNALKTKEVVIDFRRHKEDHLPLAINNIEVQRVDSYRFLGINISSSLKWKDNTSTILKKAHQRLFFLKQLKKCGVSSKGLLQFYRAAVESVLMFGITVWFGNVSAEEKRQLNKVVRTASKIIGCEVPSTSEIYEARLQKKGVKILKDLSHPANCLFNFLPSQKRLRSIKSRTTRLQNSTYPQTVRLLNTSEILF